MMTKSLLPLLLCCLITTSFLTDTPKTTVRQGKDYALFFAISDYTSWSDLRNPIKDAEAIATELKSEYGYEPRQIEIVRNPTKREVYSKLSAYQQKDYGKDGQLFIFFSGHGTFRDASKEGFFIPKDGQRNDPFQESYIPHTRLARMLDNIPSKHILLALDACYSGTFDERIAYKGLGDRPGEENIDEAEELVRRQLKNKSRLFITSGGKERTPDGKKHSPFTQRFLEGLRSYGIQDKVLTFNELIGYLELAKPTPRFGQFGSHDGGGFVFVTQTQHQEKEEETKNQEETLWQFTIQQNKPSAYRFYLASFPNGKYKSIAETRLKVSPDDMIFIKGGTFMMGCTSEQGSDCEGDEKPAHEVIVSDFYLHRHEVSRGMFRAFIEATGYVTTADEKGTAWGLKDGDWGWHDGLNWQNMGFPQTDDHPVIGVSWYDAVAYCNWKSEQERLTPCYTIDGENVTCNWEANGYSLPTEAEWEFAARSRGKAKKYAWGNGSPHGNIREEALKKKYSASSDIWDGYNDGYVYTSPVGSFEQGDLGLSDMTGNVWEWCWDWYDGDYYKTSPKNNPKGADTGSYRVLRGGSWSSLPTNQRVAFRSYSTPSNRNRHYGFRISRAAP